jgi:hypothetical protein
MCELDHGVAVRIGGDQRSQMPDGLNVGEVIELNCIGLWIEVKEKRFSFLFSSYQRRRCSPQYRRPSWPALSCTPWPNTAKRPHSTQKCSIALFSPCTRPGERCTVHSGRARSRR